MKYVAFWIVLPLVTIMFITVVTTTIKFNKLEKEILTIDVDVEPIKAQATADEYTPKVYEVLYYNKDSTDRDTWMFLKDKGNAQVFLQDLKTGFVNYLMVYGRMYKANLIKEDANYIYVGMLDQCDSTERIHFTGCQPSFVSVGSNYTVILHVLGFKIDTKT